jgi:hypothetical protein
MQQEPSHALQATPQHLLRVLGFPRSLRSLGAPEHSILTAPVSFREREAPYIR